MDTPESWVDPILAKLAVRYGETFRRMYAGVDPAFVRSDWEEALLGFADKPWAVRYAMRYLPAEKPPNAAQFRDICRRAPVPDALQLARPKSPMPDRVRQRLCATRKAITGYETREAQDAAAVLERWESAVLQSEPGQQPEETA